MPCVHEFGIMSDVDESKDYNEYEPEKYQCISVDDDIINELISPLHRMKSYFHSLNRPSCSLAHCGITLIPPESLEVFYNVVTSSELFSGSEELKNLSGIIMKAKNENKYLIHYGV